MGSGGATEDQIDSADIQNKRFEKNRPYRVKKLWVVLFQPVLQPPSVSKALIILFHLLVLPVLTALDQNGANSIR